MPAQNPISNRMKRPTPESAGIDRQQIRDAAQHFPRSFVGECEKQNVARIDPVFEQVSYAIRQSARLSRASAGNDKDGAGRRRDGRKLLFVQLSDVIDMYRCRSWRALQRVLPGHMIIAGVCGKNRSKAIRANPCLEFRLQNSVLFYFGRFVPAAP
jgi:hypothetical protein